MTIEQVLDAADAGMDASLERLFALLRIPSISTDPAYAGDCRAAAEWLVSELAALGFDAALRETPGHPMVVAHHRAPGRHMLFYGHYDVQPADPLSLWTRDPFDPALEDTPAGKVIRARGAADDKGQLMTFVEAMRAYKTATGALPGNITLLFEGEEETSSPSLVPFLKENAAELAADIALICDTGMFDEDTPAICTTLRGLVSVELTVRGPDRDLHSGMYGGPAMNPIRVLSKMIADIHDPTGRVAIPGFYDGVPEISQETRDAWGSLAMDEAAFLGAVGLSEPAGEQGYSVLEQIWARPTAEVNGIWGGYTGAGFKTVLPAEASAKVSFRLVGEQDPAVITAAFGDFLRQRLPVDCKLDYRPKDGAPGTVMRTDRPEFAAARAALGPEWPNEAVFVGGAGSIPVAGHFHEILSMDSILIGFGNSSDNIHSPNEKYDLRSFQHGIRSWVRVIAALRDA